MDYVCIPVAMEYPGRTTRGAMSTILGWDQGIRAIPYEAVRAAMQSRVNPWLQERARLMAQTTGGMPALYDNVGTKKKPRKGKKR